MTAALVILPPSVAWPLAVAAAPPKAWHAFLQFFAAEISNPRTRRAYIKGAEDFFRFAHQLPGGQHLETITSLHIAAWLEDMKARGLAVTTVKQRLAGLRMLLQALTREQVIPMNPASVVKGPRYSIAKGKTPVLTGAEMLQLLNAIDTTKLIGLRDLALIGAMAYSFGRVGAITALTVRDVFRQQRRTWMRLVEKGGKLIDIPCNHAFENTLLEWMERAGLADTPDAPLFQTFGRSGRRDEGRRLSGRAMTQAMTWEMVQRRARAAGIETAVCNHTFRATGITAYLLNGGTLEGAAKIAVHASTRTTQLYDRRSDDVTLDEIEKIRFA